jgi:excisionase family DNA binding protein
MQSTPDTALGATHDRGSSRAAFSVAETARLLGVCEASVYRALKRGELQAVMLGGRRLIPAYSIEKLLTARAG